MSSVGDFLFGGTDDTGINRQSADNARRQEFIEEQADQARQDVLGIMPQGMDALNEGYRAAIDVARRTPQAQMMALRDAGFQAQGSMLGGLGAYQDAIMGNPTGVRSGYMNQNPYGLRPVTTGSNPRLGEPFWRSERLDFLGERMGANVEPTGSGNQSYPEATAPSQMLGGMPEARWF